MFLSIEYLLLGGAILLILGIISSKTFSRFGVPSLLLFLAVGMLAGSDGIGGIWFNDAKLAQSIGTVALIFILFSGGISTNYKEIRPIFKEGLILATLGVVLTTVLTGLFVWKILHYTLLEGLLLGAIISSTDASAVFSVLRSKSLNLKPKVQSILEFESGSNDPMAVFLTIGLTLLLIKPETSFGELSLLFSNQIVAGLIIGWIMAKISLFLIHRFKLDSEGLYPVLMIALVIFTYSFTAVLNGSGFLGVYLMGLLMAKETFLHKKSLVKFNDGLAWLMQLGMFLTLGLLVFPSRLPDVAVPGVLLSAFLIIAARPVSVFISLLFSKISFKDQLFISWVGLKGSVPIILATFPLMAGVQKAGQMFDIVFFIVLISTLIQGTSIPFFSRWLKVRSNRKIKKRIPIELEDHEDINTELFEIEIPENSNLIGKKVFEADFPIGALVVMVHRDDNYLIPKGSSIFEEGDSLLIVCEKELKSTVKNKIREKAPAVQPEH